MKMLHHSTVAVAFWVSLYTSLLSVTQSAEPQGISIGVVLTGITEKPSEKTSSGSWRYVRMLEQALTLAGIDYTSIANLSEATRYRLLLFPYNRFLSDRDLETIKQFVKSGGKTVWFYVCPASLAPDLGIRVKGPVGDPDRRKFREVRFDASILAGAPMQMCQESWNIQAVESTGDGRVFAEWHDAEGRETGYPASVLSDKGAFFTHVLLNDDLQRKARFMLALIGSFLPEEWDKALSRQLAGYGRIGKFPSAEAMREFVVQQGGSAATVDESLRLYQAAKTLQTEKRYGECLDHLATAREKLEAAYYPLFSSRSPELRGIWCNVSGTPGWHEMARMLKENGFNAVFPFVGCGGFTHYTSRHTPISESARRGRDPLKECVRAAREAGLEVHAWFIVWYLPSGTSAMTLETLKQANRLQVDASGNTTNWLCPSRTENFEMIQKRLLELATDYDIDGIHLDYIRYPDQRFCFCDSCKEKFVKDTGIRASEWPKAVQTGELKNLWEAWRREQITRLVRGLATWAKTSRPNLKISAAVFGDFESARKAQGQDAADWADRKYVYFLCPMNYTNDLKKLDALTKAQVDRVQKIAESHSTHAPEKPVRLVVGLGVFSDSSYLDSPAMLADQIDCIRRMGVDGFVLFRYNAEMGNRFLPALRMGVTRLNASLPWATTR